MSGKPEETALSKALLNTVFAFFSAVFTVAFLVSAGGESKYQLTFRSDLGIRLGFSQVIQLTVTDYVASPYVTSL